MMYTANGIYISNSVSNILLHLDWEVRNNSYIISHHTIVKYLGEMMGNLHIFEDLSYYNDYFTIWNLTIGKNGFKDIILSPMNDNMMEIYNDYNKCCICNSTNIILSIDNDDYVEQYCKDCGYITCGYINK